MRRPREKSRFPLHPKHNEEIIRKRQSQSLPFVFVFRSGRGGLCQDFPQDAGVREELLGGAVLDEFQIVDAVAHGADFTVTLRQR